MMTQEHPITPPPGLVNQWIREANHNEPMFAQIAEIAARWGADQELEACCEWVSENVYRNHPFSSHELRTARRSKPPSYKELALIALTALEACASQSSDTTESVFYIRRALESLPD